MFVITYLWLSSFVFSTSFICCTIIDRSPNFQQPRLSFTEKPYVHAYIRIYLYLSGGVLL